jgi:hypothetical protein
MDEIDVDRIMAGNERGGDGEQDENDNDPGAEPRACIGS